MKKPLQTQDVAKRLDVSRDRVLQLEKKGLLHPDRTEGGTRIFDASEVDRLAKTRAEQKKK